MEFEISRVEARWKGTVDLDAEAIRAMTLDGMMFFVVGVRAEEVGATRVIKDGSTVRKDVLDVTDARVMVGVNRDDAVQFLAGANESPFSSKPLEVNDRSHTEPDVISVPSVFAVDDDVRPAEDFEEEGQIGSIYDYKRNASGVKSPPGPGAKVGKFQDAGFTGDPEIVETVETVETVASVRNGRHHKDPALRKFMESGI